MFSYKDRTYCTYSLKCTHKCSKRISDKEVQKASTLGMPISVVDYRDSCEEFRIRRHKCKTFDNN